MVIIKPAKQIRRFGQKERGAGMDGRKSFFETPKKAFLFIVCVLAALSLFIIGTTFAVTMILDSSAGKKDARDSGGAVIYEDEKADGGNAAARKEIPDEEDDRTVVTEEGSDIEDNTAMALSDSLADESSLADQPDAASPYMEVEEAKDIAVRHAGFSVSDVSFSKAKLEKEHRVMVYEIEFYKDGMEYEYEINAETGEVIEFDVEEDG